MKRLVLLVLTAVVLTACGGPSTGDKGYVDGAGVITRLTPDKRHEVGTVDGTLLDGGHMNLSSLRGKVVVINVWGSWCAPCRSEALRLAQASRDLGDSAAFLGINTRDASADNGRAFDRTYGVPYPSIFDPDGRNLLAFSGAISPSAIPSTLIIDSKGRIAASIIGELTSSRTLVDLVHDVQAEPS